MNPLGSASALRGLSDFEVKQRRFEFGSNVLEVEHQTHILTLLAKQFFHFFALLLWVAAALAFWMSRVAPDQGMDLLAYAIAGVILINGIFSFWQEYRAERALEALKSLLPNEVEALRDGEWKRIRVEDLVPDDLISIGEGDRIPGDCRIVESFGVRVNLAAITGEALPESRGAPPHPKSALLAGTILVAGRCKAIVHATGMRTEFGQIAHLTQRGEEREAPLQREIRHLSHVIALLSVSLGSVFFVIGQHLRLSPWNNALFAIGVIVANVPEGLLPEVTLALAMASQRMSKRRALVRHLPAVQSLGAASVICTDKTGTLTENQMQVRIIAPSGESSIGESQPKPHGDGPAYRMLLEIARFCHGLRETQVHGRVQRSGDPMELALVSTAEPLVRSTDGFSKIDEIPFESDRKRLTTIFQTPWGIRSYVKGAPETILELCNELCTVQGTRLLLAPARAKLAQEAATIASRGFRVLAFAYRDLPDNFTSERTEEDLIYAGLIGLEDPPRPGVHEAIAQCKSAGIRVIMVTGDHPVTARAIAREVGLVDREDSPFITGDHLAQMTDGELRTSLDRPEVHFARVASDQKLRIVQVLRQMGEVVAVTGDGVNDAPALKEADVGVAMGRSGTDVAREAADLVLLDDHFATIVDAIEEGRNVFLNIRKFITYILSSNVPELVPYLAFAWFKVPLALTVLQMLSVDLGTDLVPALALGAERPHSEVMAQTPRAYRGRLVDLALLARSYGFLGLLEAAGSFAVFFGVLRSEGWRWGEPLAPTDPRYAIATASCLSTIIVMQMANLFACRSERESSLPLSLRGNRMILFGLVTETALILWIDYSRLGNRIFDTGPVPFVAWLPMVGFALLMFGAEELRKRMVYP